MDSWTNNEQNCQRHPSTGGVTYDDERLFRIVRSAVGTTNPIDSVPYVTMPPNVPDSKIQLCP